MNATQIAGSLNFSWLIPNKLAGCAAPMLPDDLAFLRTRGIRALVRMAYPGEDDYVIEHSEVERSGLDDLYLPVPDFQPPTQEQIDIALEFIDARLHEGKPVAVSCGAGCGRTGTILACYLVRKGYGAREALEDVIAKRPCSREILERTPAQLAAIESFQQRLVSANPKG